MSNKQIFEKQIGGRNEHTHTHTKHIQHLNFD